MVIKMRKYVIKHATGTCVLMFEYETDYKVLDYVKCA